MHVTAQSYTRIPPILCDHANCQRLTLEAFTVYCVLNIGVEISTVGSAGPRISIQPEKDSQLQYHVYHLQRDPFPCQGKHCIQHNGACGQEYAWVASTIEIVLDKGCRCLTTVCDT
jgi:hypothetical protein